LDGKLISKNGKNESILRLKEQLDFMKKEMDELNSKIELLEKKDSISEWENIERIEGKSIAQLRKQEEKLSQDITVIQKDLKKKKSKSLLVLELLLLPIVFLLVTASGIDMDILGLSPEDSNPLKTRHLIENLRGDTVDTWKSWRLVGTSMNVNIVNPRGFDEEKINVIIDAITSEKSLNIDDSITHKGPKGSNSIYYTGWSGALRQASNEETIYNIPTDFNVIKSYGGEGDIIITLSNLKDNDGYTGYTKSIVDGNEILKSFITIYDISNLSDEELTTIVRHEFGHALGLGHSTAPEDLMAPTIDMTVPYISECNIDAIIDLYNGLQGSTVCEK
jgi:hypothetical protein